MNPGAGQTAVFNYMVQQGSPTITANGGAHLGVTLSSRTARSFGSSVTVTATFNAQSLIVIPNPFFGVMLPTTLSSTETAMSQ